MKERQFQRMDAKDVRRPFPLLQDLFDFAREQGVSTSGFSSQEIPTGSPVVLPEKFSPLVAEFPGSYFVTAYEDRRDQYYKEGTRHQLLRVSTVEHRTATDEKTREIDFLQAEKSPANEIEVCVREAVMDRSFADLNLAGVDAVENSHGDAKYTYVLKEGGAMVPKKIDISRLDEGMFVMGGDEPRPVRWLRNATSEFQEGAVKRVEYSDHFIVRQEDWSQDERAQAKTVITGSLEQPEQIYVEIGSGPVESATVLLDNDEVNLRVLVHAPVRGVSPAEMLKKDPVYATLFTDAPDASQFAQQIMARVQGLKQDLERMLGYFYGAVHSKSSQELSHISLIH